MVAFIHGLFHTFLDLPGVPALIVDLPGYGRNHATKALSIRSAAEFVRDQIRASGCERVHIVAHSMGGAVAVLLAYEHPELVASLINVEGNFTLKDAFWSGKIAAMDETEVEALLTSYRADTDGWLAGIGIEPNEQRMAAAERMLASQSADTVQTMARSLIEVTAAPDYLEKVRTIVDRGTIFHLLAGERSRDEWDVPDFVLQRAASMTIQPGAGHMMMLEDPAAFLQLVGQLSR
ncbi:MAG TPA: alpha/beta hydrolase [Bryobacteraceae bacterium]|nr:alpha/beta hydrolase [Bryobacteraceae bacterium]